MFITDDDYSTIIGFSLFRVEKFAGAGVDVKGVLVCDKSGLTLTSKIEHRQFQTFDSFSLCFFR